MPVSWIMPKSSLRSENCFYILSFLDPQKHNADIQTSASEFQRLFMIKKKHKISGVYDRLMIILSCLTIINKSSK
jgi:hypothetical protein